MGPRASAEFMCDVGGVGCTDVIVGGSGGKKNTAARLWRQGGGEGVRRRWGVCRVDG
jgi:hypothetical protein